MKIIESRWNHSTEAIMIDDWILDPPFDIVTKDYFYHYHPNGECPKYYYLVDETKGITYKFLFQIKCGYCGKKLPIRTKKKLLNFYEVLKLQKEL